MSLKSTTVCLGYQQITDLSSAAGLTVPATDPQGNKIQPTLALIVAEDQAVRWRDDGVAPTADIGMPLAVGVPLSYDGNLQNIRFFEQAAGATLNISYYA